MDLIVNGAETFCFNNLDKKQKNLNNIERKDEALNILFCNSTKRANILLYKKYRTDPSLLNLNEVIIFYIILFSYSLYIDIQAGYHRLVI